MCGLKKKDIFLKEIGLRAQDLLILSNSIINKIWEGAEDLYDHLMSTKIFTLMLKKVFI